MHIFKLTSFRTSSMIVVRDPSSLLLFFLDYFQPVTVGHFRLDQSVKSALAQSEEQTVRRSFKLLLPASCIRCRRPRLLLQRVLPFSCNHLSASGCWQQESWSMAGKLDWLKKNAPQVQLPPLRYIGQVILHFISVGQLAVPPSSFGLHLIESEGERERERERIQTKPGNQTLH